MTVVKKSRKTVGTKHKQRKAKRPLKVEVTSPSGRSVWVDEGMKAFIEALRDRGIETLAACQDYLPGFSVVRFLGPYDAIHFFELAWAFSDKNMRKRVGSESDLDAEEPGRWLVDGDRWNWEKGNFTLTVHVLLPTEDKDRLVELLKNGFPVHNCRPGKV
jgi:hypothetical protein